MAEFRDMRLRGVEENEHHGEDNRNEKAIQHAENRDREEGRDDEQPVPLPAEVGEQGLRGKTVRHRIDHNGGEDRFRNPLDQRKEEDDRQNADRESRCGGEPAFRAGLLIQACR